MFTLLLKATLAQTAASIVDLRTNVDGWGEGPVSGVYDPSLGGWRFDLETGRYGETGVAFKFFVHPSTSWQGGDNLELRTPRGPDDMADTFQISDYDFEKPLPTNPWQSPPNLQIGSNRLNSSACSSESNTKNFVPCGAVRNSPTRWFRL